MSDVIDRQAAIDAMGCVSDSICAQQAIDALADLPSAERTGRWKPFDLTWGRSIYACTACGDAFELPTECGKPMYKFCPYCGAKMEGEEE